MAKKKPTKAKAPKKAKKSAPKKVNKKPSMAQTPKPAPASPVAARMAAFSKQVLKEEEAPVAVRSFIEARKGVEASKELNVKTGVAKPVIDLEADADARAGDPEDYDDDDDDEPDDFPHPPAGRPQMEPLTGPLAVPKQKLEDFKLAAPAPKVRIPPKGKKGKHDDGRVELRMQRASGDETIAEVKSENLQRSFEHAAAKGRVAASTAKKGPGDATTDKFDVAMDKPSSRLNKSISDFGDVEIAQQTRSGARKLGKIDVDKEDE